MLLITIIHEEALASIILIISLAYKKDTPIFVNDLLKAKLLNPRLQLDEPIKWGEKVGD
jgi:hypothetical protein